MVIKISIFDIFYNQAATPILVDVKIIYPICMHKVVERFTTHMYVWLKCISTKWPIYRNILIPNACKAIRECIRGEYSWFLNIAPFDTFYNSENEYSFMRRCQTFNLRTLHR